MKFRAHQEMHLKIRRFRPACERRDRKKKHTLKNNSILGRCNFKYKTHYSPCERCRQQRALFVPCQSWQRREAVQFNWFFKKYIHVSTHDINQPTTKPINQQIKDKQKKNKKNYNITTSKTNHGSGDIARRLDLEPSKASIARNKALATRRVDALCVCVCVR